MRRALALAVTVAVTVVGMLVAASAVAATATTSAGQPGLHGRLAGSLHGAGLAPGRTAALAVDLRTGALVFAHNARRPFVPASNEKLAVSLAALLRLGPDWRFRTEVVGLGTRRGRVWDGDLVLKGYGDPTLTGADLAELVRTLRMRGIRTVTGRILGDESFFDRRRDAPGWKPSFVGIESPPLSALVVDRALGWPARPPAVLAARSLRDALVRRGVDVRGKVGLGLAPVEGERLAVHESPRLAEIARAMNADSDNFTAEMILKQLGTADGAMGTTAGGAAAVRAVLREAGVPLDGVRLVDGSGLSRHDRLTAAALVEILRVGLTHPVVGPSFRQSLAVSGRAGTLSERYGVPAGILRGKTGTTSLASSLSGLVRGRIVFAVLQNGDPVQFWAARAAQDRFVNLLATEVATR
jgi:D-alanyl-D-alanine carboxypeptidase/D-alanyl-D-alanine-endopeptidase (penicillin-binding protein 4)